MPERCPICGVSLETEKGAAELFYEGTLYRFCSVDCLRIFEAFPEAYSGGEEPELKAIEEEL
jgi:YHS domain-containing protein